MKESRLQEALRLFAAAGFDMYSADPDSLSPELISSMSRSSIADFRFVEGTPTQGATMTRSRSVTDPNPPKEGRLKEVKLPLPQTCPDDVQLLPSELTCVGLSDELGVDNWGLKIVKLVAFPDLISAAKPLPLSPSSVTTPSIYSSESTSSSIFDFSPTVVSSASSCSGSSSSDDEDDYSSHLSSLKSSSSLTEVDFKLKSEKITSLFELPSNDLHSPVHQKIPLSSTTVAPSTSGSQVPFFSYTKTPEGCSLTADVYILATLFPPHERHMVICSGELDAADERIANGTVSSDDDNEEDDDDSSYSLGSALRCLQIDLQRFGLGMFLSSPTSSINF